MDGLPRLVLASASPRRAELLRSLGLVFGVRAADVDESVHEGERPSAYVTRIARAKLDAVDEPDAVVVAADTTVVVDGRIIGKPTDGGEARSILRELSGRAHEVKTAVAVARRAAPDRDRDRDLHGEIAGEDDDGVTAVERTADGRLVAATVVTTLVWFVDLDPEDIERYVAGGEPLDKAGGYGIQGAAGAFVAELHGNYQNVVGLPLADLDQLLGLLGHRLRDWGG